MDDPHWLTMDGDTQDQPSILVGAASIFPDELSALPPWPFRGGRGEHAFGFMQQVHSMEQS